MWFCSSFNLLLCYLPASYGANFLSYTTLSCQSAFLSLLKGKTEILTPDSTMVLLLALLMLADVRFHYFHFGSKPTSLYKVVYFIYVHTHMTGSESPIKNTLSLTHIRLFKHSVHKLKKACA